MKQSIQYSLVTLLFLANIYLLFNLNINPIGVNKGFAPEQPIAFSHRIHAGELSIDCLYCHTGADKGGHAGIPSLNICMNCHRFVMARWEKVLFENEMANNEKRDPKPVISDELKKLYEAVGFDYNQMKFANKPYSGKPIAWTKVYDLPDFAIIDHSSHVNGGVNCSHCHGAVETMDKIEQVTDLTMGWCVNCHRDVTRGKIADIKPRPVSISCTVCHY